MEGQTHQSISLPVASIASASAEFVQLHSAPIIPPASSRTSQTRNPEQKDTLLDILEDQRLTALSEHFPPTAADQNPDENSGPTTLLSTLSTQAVPKFETQVRRTSQLSIRELNNASDATGAKSPPPLVSLPSANAFDLSGLFEDSSSRLLANAGKILPISGRNVLHEIVGTPVRLFQKSNGTYRRVPLSDVSVINVDAGDHNKNPVPPKLMTTMPSSDKIDEKEISDKTLHTAFALKATEHTPDIEYVTSLSIIPFSNKELLKVFLSFMVCFFSTFA